MPSMQNIKDSVGENDPLPTLSRKEASPLCLFQRYDSTQNDPPLLWAT
jgi:hypothetical protein